MHKVNKYLKSAVLVSMVVLAMIKPGYLSAQYYSEGGSKKTIVIDKKVGFEKGKYFDNIDRNKHIFGQDDTIYFKIIVENSGDSDLANLKLWDLLPSHLKLIYKPGDYNSKDNRLDWTISQLGIGQTKVYEISAKVTAQEQTVLKTNYVEVGGDGTSDSDRASYWVGSKSMPVTGPMDTSAMTLVLVGLSGAGLTVRRLVRGY